MLVTGQDVRRSDKNINERRRRCSTLPQQAAARPLRHKAIMSLSPNIIFRFRPVVKRFRLWRRSFCCDYTSFARETGPRSGLDASVDGARSAAAGI